jgi:hypothetical protein
MLRQELALIHRSHPIVGMGHSSKTRATRAM